MAPTKVGSVKSNTYSKKRRSKKGVMATTSHTQGEPSQPIQSTSQDIQQIPRPNEDLYTNKRKLDFVSNDLEVSVGLDADNLDAAPQYLFVARSHLGKLVENLACPTCFYLI